MNVISLDLSVVIIMLLVFSLYLILKRSFFDPIGRILVERDARINGTVEEAKKLISKVEEQSLAYQESIKKARLEGYRIQDVFRAESLKERSQVVQEGRSKAESLVSSSKQETDSQVSRAKQGLEAEVSGIADGIVKTILR
ncbi:MAG TPA: ATP synthase F0 subunit B [Terriglobia bacterium]|nr:ATP synthase F0 subunit B [Terriglobia bacterium]